MQALAKYFSSLGWDRRVTAVVMYTVFPSLVGTISRLLGVNPMTGDFFGLDLTKGIAAAFLTLLGFVCVLVIFFLVISKIRWNRAPGDFVLPLRRVKALGLFVLAFQLASLAFTLQSGFGIAASAETIDGNTKLIFILLNSDYIFFVFFLIARGCPNLVRVNAAVYLGYSVMRGWASGILVLLVLSYVKNPWKIKWKKVGVGLIVLFLMAPLLLGVREFFRSSDPGSADMVTIISDVLENLDYSEVIFVLINRFDLVPPTQAFELYYKTLKIGLGSGAVCYPWNEGIYQTIFNAIMQNQKCISPGEVLPSLIHGAFFFDRRSAFSIGAGFLYGADGIDAILVSLYLGLLLIIARTFAGPLIKIPEVKVFFVFLIVFYLVPGWYFHFIHGMNAVLLANFFLRLKLFSQSPLTGNGPEAKGEFYTINS